MGCKLEVMQVKKLLMKKAQMKL